MGNDQSYQQNSSGNFGFRVGNSQVLGRNYVTDASGRAVYIYTKDSANKSVCTGTCSDQWPAVVYPQNVTNALQQQYQAASASGQQFQPRFGQLFAAPGINMSKLGVFPRADGSLQVTFNGWPLYYYYMDTNPGDIKGQTVKGIWYLIGPEGNPIITPLIPQYQPSQYSGNVVNVPASGNAVNVPASGNVVNMPAGNNVSMPAGSGNLGFPEILGVPNIPGVTAGTSLGSVPNVPGVNISPFEEAVPGQAISYAYGWRRNVTFRNFRYYYQTSKWRNWAAKNHQDWRNYDQWNHWYRDNKDKWDDNYLRRAYVSWLQYKHDDWKDYNEWMDWHSRNVNPWY